MNIAIIGLGYVGTVSMACLARDGHQVIGVDVHPTKLESIQKGKSPIIEPGLEDLIKIGVENGNIEVTGDISHAIQQSDVALICVGTPSQENGALDTKYIERVCHDIGHELSYKNEYFVIAIRSTILPGTVQKLLIPILESSSKKTVGIDFGFCTNPEFLREGSAIRDFDSPPFTVIGQYDERSGNILRKIYSRVDAPIYQLELGAAEMVKYASNAFHALKVSFANEIGNICQSYNIDSYPVMEIFSQDTKLNLSPYYLKPGFSFGGSCLPKDVRALLYAAKQEDLDIPVLQSILPSNQYQTQKAMRLLFADGKRKIGMIGLSFKSNTDDLRESPALELAEKIIGKGLDLKIYDREVALSQLHGSNREYIENVLPHIGSIMKSSLKEVVTQSEAVVVTKKLSETEYQLLFDFLHPDQVLIDLVRLDDRNLVDFDGVYRGICW